MTRNTSKFIGYVKMAAAGMLLGGVLSSCSDLDEQDRFVYIKPADAARKVLIEDFTGQRCPNCPSATDEIHHLQETMARTMSSPSASTRALSALLATRSPSAS